MKPLICICGHAVEQQTIQTNDLLLGTAAWSSTDKQSFIIYHQAEHERQMKAAEEEVRHQKLQAELDQARVNAGKVAVNLISIAVTVGIIVTATVMITIIKSDQHQHYVTIVIRHCQESDHKLPHHHPYHHHHHPHLHHYYCRRRYNYPGLNMYTESVTSNQYY